MRGCGLDRVTRYDIGPFTTVLGAANWFSQKSHYSAASESGRIPGMHHLEDEPVSQSAWPYRYALAFTPNCKQPRQQWGLPIFRVRFVCSSGIEK
jgi:hypothetical protein